MVGQEVDDIADAFSCSRGSLAPGEEPIFGFEALQATLNQHLKSIALGRGSALDPELLSPFRCFQRERHKLANSLFG